LPVPDGYVSVLSTNVLSEATLVGGTSKPALLLAVGVAVLAVQNAGPVILKFAT
jgi:hypothetical protein